MLFWNCNSPLAPILKPNLESNSLGLLIFIPVKTPSLTSCALSPPKYNVANSNNRIFFIIDYFYINTIFLKVALPGPEHFDDLKSLISALYVGEKGCVFMFNIVTLAPAGQNTGIKGPPL